MSDNSNRYPYLPDPSTFLDAGVPDVYRQGFRPGHTVSRVTDETRPACENIKCRLFSGLSNGEDGHEDVPVTDMQGLTMG